MTKAAKINSFIIWLVTLPAAITATQAQTPAVEKISWEKKKITKGLAWKHAHTTLFGARQNLNVLEVDLRRRTVSLVYHPTKNIVTSRMAAETKGLAAVNAGFFDMKNGGSTTFIKVDGKVPDDDTTKWRKTETLNGALIIKKDGTLEVEPAGTYNVYAANSTYDDVLVTGSLLVDNGNAPRLPDVAFVRTRHPRTCLCLGPKKTLKLITVDGRAEEAAGMSLWELANLARMLQCDEAINLDGGGSTTMWINGQGESGVVNMPSDNKKFDHQGERPVSNIIAVY